MSLTTTRLRRRWVSLSSLAVWLLPRAADAQPIGAQSADVLASRAEKLAAFWRSGPLTMGETAATLSMLLAVALVVFVIGSIASDTTERQRINRPALGWLGAGAAILAWSCFVRFVLTEPNILTDGGSGYGRIMRYVEGYGGVAVLVKLLPATWAAFMWHAMIIPRVLAVFAPALLVWVARGLDFRPAVAVLAGLALASVPVHAAMTSSDHLEGAMSSLQLGGLALVLAARRSQRPDLFATGMALAAWAMFVRPEGALGFLPIAATVPAFPRNWWRRWPVLAIVTVVAVLVAVRAIALATSPLLNIDSSPGPLGMIGWGTLLFSTVLVPYWLWAPAPFAFWSLRRKLNVFVVLLVGLAAALVPVYLRGLVPDPVDTYLEAIRYGIPAMAWLALASAVALDGGCRWLASRWQPASPWLLLGLRAALALVVASPVLLHREYLARRYGHATSEQAVRQLLLKVPDGCGLLVPDDFAEGVSIEIYDRYAYIAAEAFARGEAPAIQVLPVSDFLEGKVDANRCWTFLRGPYCYHAFAGRPARACEQLEASFGLEEIASIQIEFRHHRLVSGPDVRRAPWYMERMPIELDRVLERRPAAQP